MAWLLQRNVTIEIKRFSIFSWDHSTIEGNPRGELHHDFVLENVLPVLEQEGCNIYQMHLQLFLQQREYIFCYKHLNIRTVACYVMAIPHFCPLLTQYATSPSMPGI